MNTTSIDTKPVTQKNNASSYSLKKPALITLIMSAALIILATYISNYKTSIIIPSPSQDLDPIPFSFIQKYMNPFPNSIKTGIIEPVAEKESLDSRRKKLKKTTTASGFLKEKANIKKLISNIYASNLTENEKKTMLSKIIIYIIEIEKKDSQSRQIIQDFFQEAPESFKEFTSDLLTYFFLKNNLVHGIALRNSLPINYEQNSFQKACFSLVWSSLKLDRDIFHSHLVKCSHEEKEYLYKRADTLNSYDPPLRPKTVTNRILSPTREGALILQETPKVFLYPQFLLPEDCETLTQNSSLEAALTINSYGATQTSNSRKAQVGSLIYPSIMHKEIVKKIVTLFKTKFNIPEENIEDLSLIFYKGTGDNYFRPHFDAYTPNMLKRDNLRQRVATIILYLNTVENGGETYFLKSGISVSPKQCSLLFFYNIDKENRVCNEHEGRPLEDEQGKWILTSHILENADERLTTRSSVRNSRTSNPLRLELNTVDPVIEEDDEEDYGFYAWTAKPL